jgi:hypothetical protein
VDHGIPLLYTADEAARIIGGSCTASWLTRKARAGEFPCTLMGRTRTFSRRQMAEILAICEVRADGDDLMVPDVATRFDAWIADAPPDLTLNDAFVEGFAQGLEWADWEVERSPDRTPGQLG